MRLLNIDLKTSGTLNVDKYYAYMTQVQQSIRHIFISGIKGIRTVKTSKRIILSPDHKEKITKKVHEDSEYMILETDGSNLKKCLSHHKIDNRKTYCNDMTEIYKVLGIEAARQSFINEFK